MDEPTEVAPVSAEDGSPVEVQNDEHAVKTREHATSKPHPSGRPFEMPIQAFTSQALHFLSHASNASLAACLIGLCATTYLVLGRLGLFAIGIFGGVVLQASWDGSRGDSNRDEAVRQAESARRRETSIELAKRLLDVREGRKEEGKSCCLKGLASQDPDFSHFGPQTAKALNAFVDAVIANYVHWWYDPQIPDESTFPAACRRILAAFMLSLSAHLERKRPADVLLDFMANSSSIIIVFLNELSAALSASPSANAEDAISTYLKLKPDSNLANITDEDHQDHKLHMVAEDILQAYLDPKIYNADPGRLLLKETLAKLVLGYTIQRCGSPEWINEWIVYGLEQSETTREVMGIVDAGVEGRTIQPASSPSRANADSQAPTEGRPGKSASVDHQRKISRAEEAMDEAMKEAKRLTQLMIEEDERKLEEQQGKVAPVNEVEDVSDPANSTPGAPTPRSSHSDRDRLSQDSQSTAESPSGTDSCNQQSQPVTPINNVKQFVDFDQLAPLTQANPPRQSFEQSGIPSVGPTLFNANITILDDGVPGERSHFKNKPTIDYLIQVELRSSEFSGWMISRKYTDFESLHEILRRISVITGARFGASHSELPPWKTNTKTALRQELERYINDAVRFPSLAESEGMKRFLNKEQGIARGRSPAAKKGYGWAAPDAFGKFGGDMMSALSKAPQDIGKNVAGGGKAIFGGVAGLVGGIRPNPPVALTRTMSSTGAPTPPVPRRPSLSRLSTTDAYPTSGSIGQSQDSLEPLPEQDLTRRGSAAGPLTSFNGTFKPRPVTDLTQSDGNGTESWASSPSVSRRSASPATYGFPSLLPGAEDAIGMTPPASHMSDFGDDERPSAIGTGTVRRRSSARARSQSSLRQPSMTRSRSRSSLMLEQNALPQAMPPRPPKVSNARARPKPPLSEQETAMAIELVFAVIMEMYNLSSAWQIRRTLLTAVKAFFLRPGNPLLGSIQDFLQKSTLDANLSDSGIASHIYKMRENAMPTEAEMVAWLRDYPEKTAEQKDELRRKARDLLVREGMPQALTSIMGAAASGEALGKVFDCLQNPKVSKGLMFGIMLQALKGITH